MSHLFWEKIRESETGTDEKAAVKSLDDRPPPFAYLL
jgi:hypothetical protein